MVQTVGDYLLERRRGPARGLAAPAASWRKWQSCSAPGSPSPWEQWADPRLIIAVLHNNDLNQVTREMRAMEGAPKFTESQELPEVSYADFARSLGLRGIAVDEPGQVGPAWD